MLLSIVINTVNRKEMLFLLIDSIERCNFENIQHEIIIVDDCSHEDYGSELKARYPTVTFHKNDKSQLLIKSRNIGWRLAKGEFVFFIDDDNEVFDENLFQKAIVLLRKEEIGILGCRTHYFDHPTYINVGPVKFNKYTGKTSFPLRNSEDIQADDVVLTPSHDCPNAFFTKHAILHKVEGFSEEFFQTFSEADYSEKVRKCGYSVLECSSLKVYHKSPMVRVTNLSERLLGGSVMRMYYLVRNRFLFIRKHGTLIQCAVFSLFFAPLYSLFYLFSSLRNKRIDFAYSCLKATMDGYRLLFKKYEN